VIVTVASLLTNVLCPVALASELSEFGTCVKTLRRAWVGG